MAAKPMDRVDVHTKLSCEAGTAFKVTLSKILRCVEEATLDAFFVGSILTVVIPLGATERTELIKGRVLRLVYTDQDYDEFRIDDLLEDTGNETLTIRAKSPIHELSEKLRALTETTSPLVSLAVAKTGTPTTILTAALTAAPTYWSVGTITPTGVVSVLWQGMLPLAASLEVPQAVYQTYGIRYELSGRRNGTTGYLLDCTAFNAAAVVPDIRTSKNLGPLQRSRLAGKHATALLPLGTDGGNIGDNQWEVMAVTVNTHIEVEGIDGGISPLIEADALDNYYWIDAANDAHQITDSVVVSTTRARFLLASTTGIAVGDWGRIALNSSKDQVVQLDYPSKQATYGVVLRPAQCTKPSHTNWLKNGDLADWSGSIPDQWSLAGTAPDKIQTAGLWLTGGQSAFMNDASTSLYQPRTIYFPVTGLWTYTVWIRLVAFATDGQSQVRFTDPQTGADQYFWLNGTTPGLDQLNVWVPFSRSYQITTVGSKPIQVLVGNGVQPAQFYLDSAQFAFTPSPAEFVRHSGAAQNWQQAVALLAAIGEPPAAYDSTILDLTRYNEGRWPYEQLSLGGSVNVVDENLNQTFTERAVQLLINHQEPLDTKVLFANRREELSALLGGGGVGSPTLLGTPTALPPIIPVQPPLPPLPPLDLVTDLIEVDMSTNLFRASDNFHVFDPVAFDTKLKQYGSRLRLEADGRISVTDSQPGLYYVEFQGNPAVQSNPALPDYFVWAVDIYSDAMAGFWTPGSEETVYVGGASAQYGEETRTIAGIIRCNATDTIGVQVVVRRNPSGDMLVRNVALKVRYIGPLGTENTELLERLIGVAAVPAVGSFTVVIT